MTCDTGRRYDSGLEKKGFGGGLSLLNVSQVCLELLATLGDLAAGEGHTLRQGFNELRVTSSHLKLVPEPRDLQKVCIRLHDCLSWIV